MYPIKIDMKKAALTLLLTASALFGMAQGRFHALNKIELDSDSLAAAIERVVLDKSKYNPEKQYATLFFHGGYFENGFCRFAQLSISSLKQNKFSEKYIGYLYISGAFIFVYKPSIDADRKWLKVPDKPETRDFPFEDDDKLTGFDGCADWDFLLLGKDNVILTRKQESW